ncbi:hypothetical protein V9K97_27165, partial [Variovorax sp. CCNWLW186]|uniref:hypothetical protein n=1 Tax=Variovorax sp. CCNWLW186 TaxID=3127473 RepID=UPI0030774A62
MSKQIKRQKQLCLLSFLRAKDLVMQQLNKVNQCKKSFQTLGLAALILCASGFRDAEAVAPQPAGAQCQVQAGNGVWSPLLASCQEAAETLLHYYIYARPPNPRAFCNVVYPQTTGCEIASNQSWSPYQEVRYGVAVHYSPQMCPAHSASVAGGCKCEDGFQEDATQTVCVPAPPEQEGANSCKAPAGAMAGNPILPVTAEKFRSETDFTDSSPAPLSFVRTYRST